MVEDLTNVNPVQRPPGLPDNFQSVEALANSYRELQGKFTQVSQDRSQAPPPAPQPQAPPAFPQSQPPPAPPQSALGIQTHTPTGMGVGDYVAQFSQEWNANKQLSDQSYARIQQEKGLAREDVDYLIQGRVALQGQIEQAGFEAAGGPDNYKALSNWAAQNLSPTEISSYNKAMDSGDPFAVRSYVRSMRAEMAQRTGNPDLAQTAPGSFSVQNQGDLVPYAHEKEWVDDQCKPEYKSDAAFRDKVIQRMAITKEVYDDPRKPKRNRDAFMDGALKDIRL